MKQIVKDTPGGTIARRRLPGAVLLPIFLGWVRTLGRDVGWFGPGFGTAFFVILIILVFIGLIWWTVRAVNREEGERRQAEELLHREQARTETILASITESFYAGDREYKPAYGD